MKVSKKFFLIFALFACIAGVFWCISTPTKHELLHQANTTTLKNYITKFHAHGGAYIVLNTSTNQVADKQFIEFSEDFPLWANNIMQLFNYAVGMHNGTVKDDEEIVFNISDSSLYDRINKAERDEFMKPYATNGFVTPLNLLSAYINVFKNADNYLSDSQLARLTSAASANAQTGKARKANVEGLNVSGLGSTTQKEKDNKEVYTMFVGEFEKDGNKYALITLLDAPQPLKTTFGFNSAGWNSVPLAGEIINNIAANK